MVDPNTPLFLLSRDIRTPAANAFNKYLPSMIERLCIRMRETSTWRWLDNVQIVV
jgi:hypothetical protein